MNLFNALLNKSGTHTKKNVVLNLQNIINVHKGHETKPSKQGFVEILTKVKLVDQAKTTQLTAEKADSKGVSQSKNLSVAIELTGAPQAHLPPILKDPLESTKKNNSKHVETKSSADFVSPIILSKSVELVQNTSTIPIIQANDNQETVLTASSTLNGKRVAIVQKLMEKPTTAAQTEVIVNKPTEKQATVHQSIQMKNDELITASKPKISSIPEMKSNNNIVTSPEASNVKKSKVAQAEVVLDKPIVKQMTVQQPVQMKNDELITASKPKITSIPEVKVNNNIVTSPEASKVNQANVAHAELVFDKPVVKQANFVQPEIVVNKPAEKQPTAQVPQPLQQSVQMKTDSSSIVRQAKDVSTVEIETDPRQVAVSNESSNVADSGVEKRVDNVKQIAMPNGGVVQMVSLAPKSTAQENVAVFHAIENEIKREMSAETISYRAHTNVPFQRVNPESTQAKRNVNEYSVGAKVSSESNSTKSNEISFKLVENSPLENAVKFSLVNTLKPNTNLRNASIGVGESVVNSNSKTAEVAQSAVAEANVNQKASQMTESAEKSLHKQTIQAGEVVENTKFNTKLSQATNANPKGDTNTGKEFNLQELTSIIVSAKMIQSPMLKTLTLQLNPQNLGRAIVTFKEENGNLAVDIRVNNVTAKQAIEGEIAQLRENLNNSGFKQTTIDLSLNSDREQNDFKHLSKQNSETQANTSGNGTEVAVDASENDTPVELFFGTNSFDIVA